MPNSEKQDIGKPQQKLLSQNKIINKIPLEDVLWEIRMELMSVWMKRMNNLLLSTVYGEDFRNVQMRSYGKEFQKETTPKLNQLPFGLIQKIERTTTCQLPLDQTHSQ